MKKGNTLKKEKKTDKLQIPLSPQKKRLLELRAEQLGFSNPTEAARFVINNFIDGSINISMNVEPVEVLDPETEKEVIEAILEARRGQTIKLSPSDPDFTKKLYRFADHKF